MSNLNETIKFNTNLETQFNDMLKRGVMPLIEYTLPQEDEYLIVEIELNYSSNGIDTNGLRFSFDQGEGETYFDGDIEKTGNGVYVVLFDECFDHLDHYLQVIDENMTEGFLIPNNLFV